MSQPLPWYPTLNPGEVLRTPWFRVVYVPVFIPMDVPTVINAMCPACRAGAVCSCYRGTQTSCG